MGRIKVLAINGSPRRGGNTDIILDKILEGAHSKGAIIHKVILNKLRFSMCQECDDVRDGIACLIEDDMQDIYKKIKDADVVIIGSPIFFGSISAQTKAMIDRFQCLWRARFLLKRDIGYKKKKGFFVCVEASSRKDFFKNAKSIIRSLFAIINADYEGELFYQGLEAKGDVLKHQDYLDKAFKLGERIGG